MLLLYANFRRGKSKQTNVGTDDVGETFVAHELRTPLTVMKSNLEAMQDGLLKPDTQELGGGNVRVASSRQGTIFTISLPSP